MRSPSDLSNANEGLPRPPLARPGLSFDTGSQLKQHTGASSRGVLLSTVLHAGLLVFLVDVAAKTPRLAEAKLPGTVLGTTTLTYYSPGGPPHDSARVPPRLKPSPVPVPTVLPPPPMAAKQPETEDKTVAEKGMGSSVESGLGEGDLQIALPTFSPAPKPNLAVLASGTAGDVVLDAVIDEHGHIRELKLLKGLGPAIDQSVIATVQQWTYTPATRDGKPVASGQELHFHYERG